jgi:hypothetical protein
VECDGAYWGGFDGGRQGSRVEGGEHALGSGVKGGGDVGDGAEEDFGVCGSRVSLVAGGGEETTDL